MMNEFPPKYLSVMREASDSDTVPANATEYLEYLDSIGIKEEDLPAVQPILQKRIWDRLGPRSSAEKLANVLEQLRTEAHRFHVAARSWTNTTSCLPPYG